MKNDIPKKSESAAKAHLKQLVAGWNQSSFEDYSRGFTQYLTDHYNPSYFKRLRTQLGSWLNNQYLGSLKQGTCYVHLWRSEFEGSKNDALFSLTLTKDGKIAGLLKRFAQV
jgi:hypothetical protein